MIGIIPYLGWRRLSNLVQQYHVIMAPYMFIHVLIDHIPKHEKVTSNNKNNFFFTLFQKEDFKGKFCEGKYYC